MNKIRRINFLGGPCSSKSTTATYVFSHLKTLGYSIEYVSEYIKFWTYIPRTPKSWDSFYCLSKQIHKEDTILRAGVDLITSDSPLMLAYFYAIHHNTPGQKSMLKIVKEFEETYPSINILLERKDKDYTNLGRYETIEQAKSIDEELKQLLDISEINYQIFSYYHKEKIIQYIIEQIL